MLLVISGMDAYVRSEIVNGESCVPEKLLQSHAFNEIFTFVLILLSCIRAMFTISAMSMDYWRDNRLNHPISRCEIKFNT